MAGHIYNVDTKWETGRTGSISSPEIHTDSISIATPPEFPKGVAGIWSPEHLFTAAVSSCLMTTFLAIAENSKFEFLSFTCAAEGKLEQIDGKYLMTEVILLPQVGIVNEGDFEKAQRILERAEASCLISHSIRSKVTMRSTIKLASTLQMNIL